MTRNTKLDLINSAEDWKTVRECYVKSFLRYPLYKYMVPDPSKREEFLRAYLDANYEVTVGRGQAILAGLRVAEKANDSSFQTQDHPQGDRYKLVGGVILLFPSSTGKGWAIQNDEVYWKAYEKYKLADISEEGMERVKRYEAWEFSTVTERLLKAGLPMWNGLFCAMLPEYTSQGLASKMFDKGMQLFSGVWMEQLQYLRSQKLSSPKLDSRNAAKKLEKPPKEINVNSLSTNIQSCSVSKNIATSQQALHSNGVLTTKSSSNPSLNSPLIVGICHGERSSNFYKVNGFHHKFAVTYTDEGDSFDVNVFVFDPQQRLNSVENSSR